jgi:hypothetical protein
MAQFQECEAMAIQRPLAGPATARDAGRSPAWVALAVALGAAGLAIVAYLPAPLVLPVASIVMVTTGFAIAGGAYLAGLRISTGPRLPWDIAGALVFLGFAAAMLAGDADTLSLLARIETQGLAALSR